jgi:hypothetical protein
MTVFLYPTTPLIRRHGPQGYVDYGSYKPWLRDEFGFRCVFCLTRERWFPADYGQANFAIDHWLPLSMRPDLACDYENLLYVCNICNSGKGKEALPSPFEIAYGEHLQVQPDGTVAGTTETGLLLVRLLRLNRPSMILFRNDLLEQERFAELNPESKAAQRWRELHQYPDDLPDLTSLRPPGGNTRPEGVKNCFFALRQRGELPETY